MAAIARIAFLLHSQELLNHFGPVLDLLPPDRVDLLVHGQDISLSDLQKINRWQCRARSTDEVLASEDTYHCLVSNHPVVLGDTPLIKQLATYNARFMYAAGKSGWNLSGWNSLYDLILCFGPFHAEAFAAVSAARIVQMGYPRFDRFFNDKPDRIALCAQYRCDPSRQTVVWLPTWKELSSVGLFNREIANLGERYNVVVKLHPLMSLHEMDRVLALARYRFNCLITDASDNLPLYQLADFMLFDYGGPPLAGIYADKPMILLNVPGAESDALTGADSPDITIRQHIVNVSRGDDRIASLLGDDDGWAAQQMVRQTLRERYFAPHFGNSSRIAADTLLEALATAD